MKLIINLPIRAKSCQDKKIARRGKFNFLRNSDSTMNFKKELSILLAPYKCELSKLTKLFDKKTHVIYAEWVFSFDNFYTKEGHINSKIPDIDNCLKAVTDVIFNESLLIDDHFISRCHVERCLGNDSISLKIKIINK